MANTILHKRNSTPGTVPTSGALSQGELGINIGDGKLYTKNSSNNIINIGVTSISGTSITPSSGNFSNYLAVSGVPVSVSGHSHASVPQAQSLVTNVFNKTASTIPKFSVVYINGGQGDQPTIQLAIANGETGSSNTYGITAEAISSMSTGSVIVAGALSGINTDQFNPTAPAGDVNGITLYLSPSVSGAATTTKPYAPNHLVSIGNIVRTHQNEGIVEVKIQNGFELQELHNVAVTGATNGQFLQYNSGSGLWIPSSSGNFSALSVNNTGVSLSGHNHNGVYADIATGDPQISSNSIVDRAYSLFDPANDWAALWINDTTVYAPDSAIFDSFKFNMGLSDAVTGNGIVNHIPYWNSTNGIVADSGQLYWDSTNDRLGIRTSSPIYPLDISGIIRSDSFTSTRNNSITAGSGQIYLNGSTGNRIDFNASGVAPPDFTNNRSVGTKIVLYPNTSSTQTEYAIGIENGAMWHSVPVAASRAFKWYAGTAGIATLLGNGTLNINGSTSQINVDNLRLDNNILSITTANTDLILSPNGNGSLLADPSGNVRGIYSNDFQRERTSASGVAAGGYSVIAGGSDNRAANSYSTIAGGQSNTASNTWTTIAGGDSNTSSGSKATVGGGGNNLASALSATVAGGSNNEATGPYAIVPGGFRAKATRQGELSHAAGFFNAIGDAQHTVLIVRRLTTDATENVVLTLNGSAPVSTNILNIPAQTMWTFSIKLSAYNVTNNEGAWWIFRGGIRRNNSNATVLVGSLISENDSESSLSAATASVVADDTNEALEIRVNGIAGKSIRWVAVVDISQVSYGTP